MTDSETYEAAVVASATVALASALLATVVMLTSVGLSPPLWFGAFPVVGFVAVVTATRGARAFAAFRDRPAATADETTTADSPAGNRGQTTDT